MARPRPIVVPGPSGMGGKQTDVQASIDPIAAINLFRKLAGKPSLREEQATKQSVTEFDVLQQLGGESTKDIDVSGFTPEQKAASLPFFRDLIKGGIEKRQAIATEQRKAEAARGVRQEEQGFQISKEARAEVRKRDEPPTPTTLQKNAEFVSDAMGIPLPEAISFLKKQPGSSLTVDKDGNVSFTQGVDAGVSKPTGTAIEKEIISAQKTIGQLNEAEKLFQPDFLTRGGKLKAFTETQADKLGFESKSDFLKERSAWLTQSKQAFLAYRKWVTGVAGGEKEMADIAKAFPDPDNNSPKQYVANLEQTRKWGRALTRWLQETKANGLSIGETREIIEQEEAGGDASVTDRQFENPQAEIDSIDEQIRNLGGTP